MKRSLGNILIIALVTTVLTAAVFGTLIVLEIGSREEVNAAIVKVFSVIGIVTIACIATVFLINLFRK